MLLKSLQLVNFRSHSAYEAQFTNQVVAFVGNNGIGKTNLLDAIHHLCYAKGFLNSVDNQNIKTDSDFYFIQGIFSKEEQKFSITCSLKKGIKKVIKNNDKIYKTIAEHIGKFTAIVISPNDTIAVNEGSDERRKLLDILIAQMQPEYLNALIRYNHILKQRNTFLKQNPNDLSLLDAYNFQLHQLGSFIYKTRKETMLLIQPLFQDYYNKISEQKEIVEMIYESDLSSKPLIELLEETRAKDLIIQNTSKGIHKDDVLFKVNDLPMKKYASQGQQKSVIIAVKLAQYELLKTINNNKPLFLLDDIFDKLDKQRVTKLITLILNQKNNGQIFITHTDKETLAQILTPILENFDTIELE